MANRVVLYEVVQCKQCFERGVRTLHNRSENRCPVCGAPPILQSNPVGEKDFLFCYNHPLVNEMIRQESLRKLAEAVKTIVAYVESTDDKSLIDEAAKMFQQISS